MTLKMLVVSDSHGNYTRLQKIIEKEMPFDYMVHCGDGVNDLFQVDIPGKVKILKVAGNVDRHRTPGIQDIDTATIEGKRIMIVHGDRFGVNYGYDRLVAGGRKLGACVIFFGHTHIPFLRKDDPVLFNPGTVSKGSYGIVMFAQDISFFHKNLS